MRKLALARLLDAARCRRDFFFRSCICDRIPRNVAKRYFAKRYLWAPLIHVNRRSSRFHSFFNLNYDKIIRAVDIFVMPDLAALRTTAIQVDRVRVRFRTTRTSDPHYAAISKFPIYDVRKYILKVILAVSGCRPNALIFLGDSSSSHRRCCQTEGKSCETDSSHDLDVLRFHYN